MITHISPREAELSRQIDEQGGQLAAWRDRAIAAEARVAALEAAIQTAYGYLWCVNNEPGTPNQYSPERAVWWAKAEEALTTNGKQSRFRNDRPSYAQMAAFARDQGDMFDPNEEGIACFCGD